MAKGSSTLYRTIGASNHADHERQSEDFYATSPIATELLLGLEQFSDNIWECACGQNHMTDVLRKHGHNVRTSDIIDRVGDNSVEIIDFLNYEGTFDGDIVTNPPYKYAQEFVEKALNVVTDGHKVAMFLKVQFLEGQKRKKLFEKYPFKILYVSSSRLSCAINGDWDDKENQTSASATCFCWYVWEKGFHGTPQIKWFN